MISRKYFISAIFLSFVFSFTFNDDLIPVTFNGDEIDKPFLGGLNRPKIQWLDWDDDDDLDLFILDVSGYIRFLENVGNSSSPNFKLITTSFQNLYCGGWFFFEDFDFDGKVDLMAQNKDQMDNISFYKNYQGELIFLDKLSIINDNAYVISSYVMTPTFADIDNDGDLDFFTGNNVGTLTFYKNVQVLNGLPVFEFITNSWQDIYIVGGIRTDDRHGASAITFIDLDSDGDLDLSWGDFYQQSLYIIWNSGTAEVALMNEVTNEYPPSSPIISAGQNMPTFADLDGDGDEDLFVTVLSGAYGNQLLNNFFYYQNIGTNGNSNYVYVTNNYFSMLDFFSNSNPELVDIDNDGDLDLFVANQYDMSESPWVGKIHFFRNIGTNNDPVYYEEQTSLLNQNMGQMLAPEFGDLDGDGDQDLLVGDFNGFIKYYENNGSIDDISFTYLENIGNIDLSGNSNPSLGDLDGDGDLDLLIGQLNGSLVFYRNVGSQIEYDFQLDIFDEIAVSNNSSPELVDKDNDGDLDLILGSGSEGIKYFWNSSEIDFSFEQSTIFLIPNIGLNTKPTIGHLFNFNVIDMIVGVSSGGLYHLQFEVCTALGDINDDSLYNVLDIVLLANCVLVENCIDQEADCSGDINNDSFYNILDIVLLANCILSENCQDN